MGVSKGLQQKPRARKEGERQERKNKKRGRTTPREKEQHQPGGLKKRGDDQLGLGMSKKAV